jgi:phosphatidylglycerol---prolipoprotein diacylglyceryl transferase
MINITALAFPNIDPVAISLFGFGVRWYALAYIVGILGGWWLIKRLDTAQATPILNKTLHDDMMLWGVVGVVLGGRLGYVLFYNLPYFIDNPIDIFKTWQGGMSFHGGALGVILSFFLFARVHKLSYLHLMDLICCAVPIGLFFGRLANFANGELFGRVTYAAYGMVFPYGGALPRHPSQLYEAVLEGLVLFSVLMLLSKKGFMRYPSFISGAFLAGYGIARFMVEFVREPDAHIGLLGLGFSMGQWLCIPMILTGAGLMTWSYRKGQKTLSS